MLSLTNPPNRPDILKYGWPNSTGNLGVRPGSAKIVWLNDVRHQAGFGCLKQIFQDVMLARLCSLQVPHNCVWLGLDVKIHYRKQHTQSNLKKRCFGLFLYKISASDTATKIDYQFTIMMNNIY